MDCGKGQGQKGRPRQDGEGDHHAHERPGFHWDVGAAVGVGTVTTVVGTVVVAVADAAEWIVVKPLGAPQRVMMAAGRFGLPDPFRTSSP